MLSIYGTCAVLAGIAGRNKLLINLKSTSLMTGAFLLCVSFEARAFGEESALGRIPEG